MADSIRNLADITTVDFLGDNVYPDGVRSDTVSYKSTVEEVLRQQVVAGTTEGATAIFVAGNHDWKHALPGIIAQAELVSQFGGPKARYLPQPAGCPGPESVTGSGSVAGDRDGDRRRVCSCLTIEPTVSGPSSPCKTMVQ